MLTRKVNLRSKINTFMNAKIKMQLFCLMIFMGRGLSLGKLKMIVQEFARNFLPQVFFLGGFLANNLQLNL